MAEAKRTADLDATSMELLSTGLKPEAIVDPADPEACRETLDEKHADTLAKLREVYQNFEGNSLKFWKSPTGDYKTWIKEAAKSDAERYFKLMENLSVSRADRLKTFSRMTAEKLAEHRARVAKSDEVKQAVEAFEKSQQGLLSDYRSAAKALREEWREENWGKAGFLKMTSLIPGVKDPLDWAPKLESSVGTEEKRMKQAANEVKLDSQKELNEYKKLDREQFKRTRDLGLKMRSILEQKDPSKEILNDLDELLAAHIQSDAGDRSELIDRIEDLFAGDTTPDQKNFVLKMAESLRSEKGKRAEMFYQIFTPQIAGKGTAAVLGQLKDLRLGAKLSIRLKGGALRDCKVWTLPNSRGEMLLREETAGRPRNFLIQTKSKPPRLIARSKRSEEKSRKVTDSNIYNLEDVEFQTQFPV